MNSTVFFNGRFFSQRTTGVQRYANLMIKAIDEVLSANNAYSTMRFYLVHPRLDAPSPSYHCIKKEPFGVLSGFLWEQLELPRLSKSGVLVNLCNSAPICASSHLTVIHDLSPLDHPEWFSRSFSTWYSHMLPIIFRKASRIITDSSFSCSRIQRWFPRHSQKVRIVIPGSFSIPKSRGVTNREEIFSLPFFLFVGSLEPRKNLKNLLRAWEIFFSKETRCHLLVAGATEARVFRGLSLEKIPPNVHFIGYASDSTLQVAYSKALAFVYPSFYEGFGIPILEAMSEGCPVIASNAASIPEVAGESTLFCDPQDPASIAERLLEIWNSPDLRRSLILRGYRRVQYFDWNRAAKDFLREIFQKTLDRDWRKQ